MSTEDNLPLGAPYRVTIRLGVERFTTRQDRFKVLAGSIVNNFESYSVNKPVKCYKSPLEAINNKAVFIICENISPFKS